MEQNKHRLIDNFYRDVIDAGEQISRSKYPNVTERERKALAHAMCVGYATAMLEIGYITEEEYVIYTGTKLDKLTSCYQL